MTIVWRAQSRALVTHHVGDYEQLFQLLKSRAYCQSSHAELQALWFAGQYAVAQVGASLNRLYYLQAPPRRFCFRFVDLSVSRISQTKIVDEC